MMRRWNTFGFLIAVALFFAGCSAPPTIDGTAEAYTKLALALGEHDEAYVGYYVGPNEWLAAASVARTGLPEILDSARKLHEQLATLEAPEEPMERLRFRSLEQLLTSMIARIEILQGKAPASFDEETKRLYDVVLPVRNDKFFRGLIEKLNEVLPGEGPLVDRLGPLQERSLIVPPQHLPAVFEAAVAECRRRTLEHLELPENERVTFEYVVGTRFGVRTIYAGQGTSVLQVDTETPMSFDAVINLACHEGYPGHHVQSVLMDLHLVRERGWVEFTVAPLYSAGALLAEGAASYGVDLVFTDDEIRRFKAEVLLPLAGIDPAELGPPPSVAPDVRAKAKLILEQLRGVREEVARQYLDGTFDRDTAIQWLSVFGLLGGREAAAGYLDAIERDRSYLIHYGYGKQYVRWLIEKKHGAADEQSRWDAMADLFTRPLIVTER
jgi:hypothetical protein